MNVDLETEVKIMVANILEIPAQQLSLDSEMENIEQWDSLRNLMILSQLEEHFDIMFPEDDIFDLTSVRAIVDEIAKIKA